MGAYKIPDYTKAVVKLFDFSDGLSGGVDEKLAPVTAAKLSYNFKMESGALKDGYGVSALSLKQGDGAAVTPTLPSGKTVKKCYFYKRYDTLEEAKNDRIMVYASDGKIYEYVIGSALSSMTEVIGLTFTKAPSAVCYKLNGDDVIIFSKEGGGLLVYDGEAVTDVPDAPEITSMCIHSERLFVTTGGESTSLWYSDDFNPTEWYVSLNNAGFIDFQDERGALIKAVDFNGYVYVFRSYGISRLSAYSDQTEFSVTSLTLSSGKIYKNSVTECGDKIVYLAEDGFYSFDGLYATRILKKLDKYLVGIDNSAAVGRFFNGSLYMSLNMKINNESTNVLLCYSAANGSVSFMRGASVSDMELISTDNFIKLALICGEKSTIGMLAYSASLYGVALVKEWESGYSDFGIPYRKTLRKMSLYSKSAVTVTITSNEGSVTAKLSGSEARQSFTVGLKGDTFKVKFVSNAENSSVSKAALYFDYFRR